MRFLLVLTLSALLSLSAAGEQLLPDSLICFIDSACAEAGLTIPELGFEKKWVEDDTFRLALIDRILDEPLSLTSSGDEFARVLSDSLTPLEYLPVLTHMLGSPVNLPVTPEPEILDLSGQLTMQKLTPSGTLLKSTLAQSELPIGMSLFLTNIALADSLLTDFYEQLSVDDRQHILYQSIATWSEENSEDSEGLLFSPPPESDSLFADGGYDRLYTIAARTDLTPLYQAFHYCLSGLEAISSDPDEYAGLSVPWCCSTPWGNIQVGTFNDDRHTDQDFLLLIDPGGNDFYAGGIPRAVGDDRRPAMQFCLDLSGDDMYHAAGTAVSQGSAVLGIAILSDQSGRDTYLADMHTQGSALFGAGLLFDGDGDDSYRGDYFAQGAAHFGLGLLFDDNGDDLYHAAAWCQGMGGTFGSGVLVDRQGDDRYSAGGAYLHKPLRPQDYRSFAQGFAMGYRDRAGGGIGLLLDGDGNDFYDAEIYAQGCSYWYSLGILIDQHGNDHYQATQYAQGAGIHLSCGLLADGSGDDHYFSRFGPSLGTGHDYSVGMLLDMQGDDSYQVSGGIGVSLTNSFGMLLDNGGNDIYSFSEVWGLGAVRHARGYAGTALFLDLGGRDIYPAASPAANDTLWHQHDYGIGWDRSESSTPGATSSQPAADSLQNGMTMPLDSLWNIASEWGVGENRIRVPQARKALADRIDSVVPFLQEERKLDTTSGLVHRVLKVIVDAEPDAMTPLLLEAIADSSRDARILALGLLSDTLFQAHASIVASRVDTLRDRELRTTLLTLGAMRSVAHLPLISGYLNSEQEQLRLTAVRALAATYSRDALPHLMQGLCDPMFTVRSGVIDRLGRFELKDVLRELPQDVPQFERRLVLDKCLLRTEEEGGWWTRWRIRKQIKAMGDKD